MAKVGGKAGLSLLEYGVLGVVLLLSLVINVAAVWKLSKVQDKRVEDQNKTNERLENLNTKTLEVLGKLTAVVESVDKSSGVQTAVLQGVKSSVDTLLAQGRR